MGPLTSDHIKLPKILPMITLSGIHSRREITQKESEGFRNVYEVFCIMPSQVDLVYQGIFWFLHFYPISIFF